MSTPEDRPKEDASFAAGARHGPPAHGWEDDARGSAPGTLERKSGRLYVWTPAIEDTTGRGTSPLPTYLPTYLSTPQVPLAGPGGLSPASWAEENRQKDEGQHEG